MNTQVIQRIYTQTLEKAGVTLEDNGEAVSLSRVSSQFQQHIPVLKRRNREAHGDGEVHLGDEVVSFRCPVSLVRIDIPAKGVDCTHTQCFDLRALRIDAHFMECMQHLPSEDRCLFSEDGSFRAINEEDVDRVFLRKGIQHFPISNYIDWNALANATKEGTMDKLPQQTIDIFFYIKGGPRGEKGSAAVYSIQPLSMNTQVIQRIYTQTLEKAGVTLEDNGEAVSLSRVSSQFQQHIPVLKRRNREAHGDGEVHLGDEVVSFRCPVSLVRIDIPAKGVDCTHTQCFDLRALRIDAHFMECMQHLPSEDRCLFSEDGSFRAINEEDVDRVDTRLTAGRRKRVRQESATVGEVVVEDTSGGAEPALPSSSSSRGSSSGAPEVEVIEID
ncbi:hypothetical protein BJ684DRAFT_20895 [Piptocephalis cylindrospora]|uniref:SP-RING-type domain-containing protein n=1 Tax=Piptocephalis cylindrospora TaxID=1907219 RepID=A0A4P9Y1N8_9FUNG|nr:hypothetical protein BJ684DRAFT_20895 [Piptocephalis cylindrospora]|eukprot:RKP12574.1 hypothetical protein BJ684DRAFT_20895 [Piptocephalis cylindrospora]